MNSARPLILVEANEIPFRVFDEFARGHPGSALAEIMRESRQLITVCEDQVELDPWISWPTLERGVIDELHQIFHLGQSLEQANESYPPVWELLAKAGLRVGIMGSLHTSTWPKDLSAYEFYLPDFFANESFAHPGEMASFQAFNLAMTRASARNVSRQLPIRQTAAFLFDYARCGMTRSTLRWIAASMLAELRVPHLICRRRSIQPLLTLDLFLHQLRRKRPEFATFFTNHVAAAMHRYWAAAFPGDAAGDRMPGDWRAAYANEIDHAMMALDVIVGRIAETLRAHNGILMVCGSLGQAAVESSLERGFHTITDLPAFMGFLGLEPSQWTQRFAMVPCLSVVVNEGSSDAFELLLRQLEICGRRMTCEKREIAPMSYWRNGASFQLFVFFERLKEGIVVRLGGADPVDAGKAGIGYHVHQDNVACSARHTPDGALLVWDSAGPVRTRDRQTISTLAIAPAILQHFDVAVPAYMLAPDAALLDRHADGVALPYRMMGGGVETTVRRTSVAAGTSDPGTQRARLTA